MNTHARVRGQAGRQAGVHGQVHGRGARAGALGSLRLPVAVQMPVQNTCLECPFGEQFSDCP